jgi:hypothetical protein
MVVEISQCKAVFFYMSIDPPEEVHKFWIKEQEGCLNQESLDYASNESQVK